jgi:aminomethyltransferase
LTVARSPLHEVHAHAGARFTDFGGWEMPVQYEGVIAEHGAVRSSVGVFDVSHLGRFELSGAGTTSALLRLLCNDIRTIDAGRAQYSMMLNAQGGVIDDLIVWRWSEDRVWVLPNGANLEEVQATFAAQPGSRATPLRERTVMLAVQGPDAIDAIESVVGVRPGRFRVSEASLGGHTVWVGGTGYTGERGAEIAIDADAAPSLWSALIDAGATPCGLGARDTLRLEMGYPLWGQDLDLATTPLEAGLDWVVGWDHDFVGRGALARQRAEGVQRRLAAFTTAGRKVPRHGYALRSGHSIGTVTSGNFSPTLGHGIGIGYLSPPVDPGAGIEVEIRGEWLPATQVNLPFLER